MVEGGGGGKELTGMTVLVTVIDPFGTTKALNAGSRRPIMG